MHIIPKPTQITQIENGEIFALTSEQKISSQADCKHLAESLNAFIAEALAYRLAETQNPDEAAISIFIDKNLTHLEDGGYQITVSQDHIQLNAYQEPGLFYAIQTLKQIIHQAAQGDQCRIPALEIEDQPQYRYRGFMFDVGRHFFGKDEVMRLIDLAALHKLNIFHWHLTEDQGWRIEIEAFPRLTEIGAWRSATGKNKTPHGGFYTQEDVREVVRYAAERYIMVIPEIDMPGHIRSAIAAYPHLGCTGEENPVATRFGIHKDIACAGKESTYEFLEQVLDEIIDLFPGSVIHLGGDEAPKKRWKACPDCQAKIKNAGLEDEEGLQGYFTNRMVKYLREKGKRVQTWNESLYSEQLDPDVVVQFWMERGGAKRMVQAINSGRQTVVSEFFHTYLDYPYGMTPLRKTFRFDPILKGIHPENAGNILGIEAPLWTEFVRDQARIDYQVFPRLSAVAELAWSDPQEKDYADFKTRLATFCRLLDHYQVGYASLHSVDPNRWQAFWQIIGHITNIFK